MTNTEMLFESAMAILMLVRRLQAEGREPTQAEIDDLMAHNTSYIKDVKARIQLRDE